MGLVQPTELFLSPGAGERGAGWACGGAPCTQQRRVCGPAAQLAVLARPFTARTSLTQAALQACNCATPKHPPGSDEVDATAAGGRFVMSTRADSMFRSLLGRRPASAGSPFPRRSNLPVRQCFCLSWHMRK